MNLHSLSGDFPKSSKMGQSETIPSMSPNPEQQPGLGMCREARGRLRSLTWKNGWFLTSCAPWGPAPSRFLGSLQSSRCSRSCATGPIRGGKGGEHFRIRLGGLAGRQGQRAPPQPCPGPSAALCIPPYSPGHLCLRVPLTLQREGRGPRQQLEEQDAQAPPVHSLPGRAKVRACGQPGLTPPTPPLPPVNPPCHALTCCG